MTLKELQETCQHEDIEVVSFAHETFAVERGMNPFSGTIERSLSTVHILHEECGTCGKEWDGKEEPCDCGGDE